uniref:SWIM-type domain-containing protein n=1 Tax=Syphacia muris TaxID=451379 RepID=A0A0N5AJS0_9BILA
MSYSPNHEEQVFELNPNDLWLMQAAGEDDELENSFEGNASQRDEDQFSFEDSERFEEDSLCSWVSDTESLNQNWRGWNAPRSSSSHFGNSDAQYTDSISLPSTSHRYVNGYANGAHCSRHSSNSALKISSPIPGPSCHSCSRNLLSGANSVSPRSLAELAARKAAKCFSFNGLESSYHKITRSRIYQNMQTQSSDSTMAFLDPVVEHVPIPDKFFLSIVRWCFPESEEDIRLYSCLANGNVEEFGRGEYLYQTDSVHDVFQIGYHLSATVTGSVTGSLSGEMMNASVSPTSQNLIQGRQLSKTAHNISVMIDRCRIVSCSCSCNYKASWCQHVVAACLYRINKPQEVNYRVTIWDAVNELDLKELKKFAQFFINELPRQYLPLAQRLIDQLRNPASEIHRAIGAPDPTDGGHDEVAIWCLDQKMLHENIRRIMAKFCTPSPTVHCDVNYLSTSQPAAAAEWQLLLRPHRSREPEGLWNLMSIIREMFKRHDENASTLLHIVTEECFSNSQVLMWWYQTCLAYSGNWFLCSTGNKPNPLMSNQSVPQFSCASLCEEIIQLWRLAVLNPRLSDFEREQMANFLQIYHRSTCERIWKIISSCDSKNSSHSQGASPVVMSVVDKKGERLSSENARFTVDLFPGFFTALKACYVNWKAANDDGVCRIESLHANSSDNCQLLTQPSHSVLSQLAPELTGCSESSYSFWPIKAAQRVSSFSDHLKLSDLPCTSTFHNSHCQHYHRNLQHHNASVSSKRKKRSKMLRKRNQKSRSLGSNAINGMAQLDIRSFREQAVSENGEDESAELGQESEDTGHSIKSIAVAGDMNSDNLPKCLIPERNDFYFGDIDELFAFAHEPMSTFDMKFTKYEALVSHGYYHLACKLAAELANEIVKRPQQQLNKALKTKKAANSDEQTDGSEQSTSDLRKQKDCRIYQNALTVLSRAISLVQTLVKDRSTYKLAFTLAIYVLEMPRTAACNKFLEVKLYHLEMELVTLLRHIEITQVELEIIRECAKRFIANIPARTSKIFVLPISLAHYMLDVLSYSHNVTAVSQGRRYGLVVPTRGYIVRLPSDEELAIKVALEVLNMKLMVAEADYPMLCESTRRQRGELALTMLMRYKDSAEKLALILDGLLDPKMHRMYKDHLSNAAYFVEQNVNHNRFLSGQRPKLFSLEQEAQWLKENNFPDGFASVCLLGENFSASSLSNRYGLHSADDKQLFELSQMDHQELNQRKSECCEDGADGISEDSTCQKDDALVSETCSGSTSPPHGLSKRNDSLTDNPIVAGNRPSDLSNLYFRFPRRKPIPSLPNQPSEAHAHYMMELAKRLLVEAGGSQSTAVFNAAQNLGMQNNQQHSGPHRQLHICAFLIGLYALGLSNSVSPSWQTRTYSTNVSWINGQAIEIGCSVIRIVERVWESHLTPTEAADLADKASQSRDPGMVEAAAKLALSVLPKAYALTATESQKALHQCKEQSVEMLERACHAVEQAAEKDGVYPEVLFKVAHLWYDMFCDYDSSKTQKQYLPTVFGSNAALNSHSSLVPGSSTNNMGLHTQPSFAPYPGNGTPLQMPLYNPQQQSVRGQPQYYHVPPNSHNGTHPVVLPSTSTVQPQILLPCGIRQGNLQQSSVRPLIQQNSRHLNQQPVSHSPNRHIPVNVPQQTVMFNPLQQQFIAGYSQNQAIPQSARMLHMSHSAPNLNPLQISLCRRGIPSHATQSSQPYNQVTTIPEHVTQNSVLPRQHHLPANLVMAGNPMPNQIGNATLIMPACYNQTSVNHTLFNGDPHMAKLVHAHRVGMKAMETMGNGNHDDTRGYAKFSQNPAYADDVQWLFSIACKLGGIFVQTFCEVAARAVASPFVLFKLVLESREVFKSMPSQIGYHPSSFFSFMRSQYATPLRYSPAPQDVRLIMVQNGYDPSTADLMQHCIEMFYAAATSKLSHPRFVLSDTEEVIQLIKTARDAFYIIPVHGKTMFEEFLKHVKKQKACKRDVVEGIKNCLQQSVN